MRTGATRSARSVLSLQHEATPPVPVAYLPLYTYLHNRYASRAVLSFEQIEAIMGCALPPSARTQAQWWTDAPSAGDQHAEAWRATERAASPNMPAGNVSFERAS